MTESVFPSFHETNMGDGPRWVYGIFRHDKMQAYIGITGNVRIRISAHISQNPLFMDGFPEVIVLDCVTEHEALWRELVWHDLARLDGWRMLSRAGGHSGAPLYSLDTYHIDQWHIPINLQKSDPMFEKLRCSRCGDGMFTWNELQAHRRSQHRMRAPNKPRVI